VIRLATRTRRAPLLLTLMLDDVKGDGWPSKAAPAVVDVGWFVVG
jgi:hypothetical protein